MVHRSAPPRPSARNPAPPDRAWQRMLSGRRLDLLDPSPIDVEIDDIAHGLARVARWNGQTEGPFALSVAQHSLMVETLLAVDRPKATRAERLAALLHDAPEYVIGDMISPFKGAIGPAYKEVEERLQRAIHLRFGLPATLPPDLKADIKRADRIAAFSEAVAVAGFTAQEARRILGYRRKHSLSPVEPMAPEAAKSAFLDRFERLFVA